jgi:predicted methyltransferase
MIRGIGPVYAKRVVATNVTHRIDRKLVKTDIAAAGFRFKAR